MLKFKRRAKVRVSNACPIECFRGADGMVIRRDPLDETPYLVRFKCKIREGAADWIDHWFPESELETR